MEMEMEIKAILTVRTTVIAIMDLAGTPTLGHIRNMERMFPLLRS
jgi:hypothetical protein